MQDRTEVIRARIEPSLKEQFDAVCAEQDRTASQILRDLIRDYVRANQQPDLLVQAARTAKRGAAKAPTPAAKRGRK